MRMRLLGLSAGIIVLGCFAPSWALLQTHFELLGVSTDLEKLGVMETWVEDGSGFPVCEVRVYQKDRWEPEMVKTIRDMEDDTGQSDITAHCKSLQQEVIQQYALQPVKWSAVPVNPKPPAIKDEAGRLVPDALNLDQKYPANQLYTFTLPNTTPWQIWIQSTTHPSAFDLFANPPEVEPQQQPHYAIAFRPQLEPVTHKVIRAPYRNGEVLMMPIKLLYNSKYGIVITMFRDVRFGFEGADYHYRPYFMSWPDYRPLSAEEARQILARTSEYVMIPDNLQFRDTNTMHAAFRAYQRLKAEGVSLEEIQTGLYQASSAGKLYWLALLYNRDPEVYKNTVRDLVQEVPKSVQVIQLQGDQWQPRSMVDLVYQQARMFHVEL